MCADLRPMKRVQHNLRKVVALNSYPSYAAAGANHKPSTGHLLARPLWRSRHPSRCIEIR